MTDEIVTALTHIGVLAAFAAVGAIFCRRDFRLSWLIAALALYFLYDGLLTRLFFFIPNYPVEVHWNWLGKAMSFAGILAIASLPMFGYKKVGLTLKQRPKFRTPLIVFLVLMSLFLYLAISDTSEMADIETIAFQWTMPSLDEELFYRGVFLLMMNEAFTRRVFVLGAPIGYGGLLTSLLFGLAHGLGFSDGHFHFDLMTFLMTGVPSLVLLWLRERTGSLLLPMLGHSASNGLFTVI